MESQYRAWGEMSPIKSQQRLLRKITFGIADSVSQMISAVEYYRNLSGIDYRVKTPAQG